MTGERKTPSEECEMSQVTQPQIRKPDIVVADTSPLVHLSQAGALHLLHEIGGTVVIVDMVLHEATRNLSKPEAENLRKWAEDGMKQGSNRFVRYERTETGRVFETALKVDPDYRMKDGGETAIVQWLVETIDGTDLQTIVIYENGKVPNWIGNRNLDADIDVLTTRAFLELAERNRLIASADAVWARIDATAPTANPRVTAFIGRRLRTARPRSGGERDE